MECPRCGFEMIQPIGELEDVCPAPCSPAVDDDWAAALDAAGLAPAAEWIVALASAGLTPADL